MISTTIVTHNRLHYTKRTIKSYLKNTVIPHELIIVDNASTDRTQKYLLDVLHKNKQYVSQVVFNTKNEYPGKATNQGWKKANKKCVYLHRSDNDMIYSRGWDKEVIQAFKDFPRMGQLGLTNELYQVKPELHNQYESIVTKGKTTLSRPMNTLGNVGGTCVVKKEIWDKGIRWVEDKWDSSINEDSKFSWAVMSSGKYDVYELMSDKVKHIGFGDIADNFNYYFKSYWQRGWLNHFYERLSLEQAGKIKNHNVT